MRVIFSFLALLAANAAAVSALAPSAFGAEYALLASGAQLRIERHEEAGAMVRLYTSAEAFIELPASAVTGYEPIAAVPVVPPSAAPAAPVTPGPAPVAEPKAKPTPQELVDRVAEQHGLPPALVHAVVRAESAYRQDAISPKGAIGMMQLMPATAASLNVDPYDAEQNVEAGTRYLRQLLLQYQDYPDQVKRALAAYNAGPGAVQKYNGVPPYRETQLYVHKVVEHYRKSLPKTE